MPSLAGGAGALMAAAVGSRAITFALNFALLRFVTSDVVGFASNDMELMLSLLLFLSREAVRIVALRGAVRPLEAVPAAPAGDAAAAAARRHRQQAVNTAWLPVPVGAALCGCAAVALALSTSTRGEEAAASAIFIAAAALELLMEPLYILASASTLLMLRARAEMLGSVARAIVTFAAVAGGGLTWMGFALGQLAFAAALAATYIVGVRAFAAEHGVPLASLAPRWLGEDEAEPADSGTTPSLFARQCGDEVARLLPALAVQSALKHLLTEGDRLVMMRVLTREQRGVYAVVTNYGSLPARFLFQPLEEALRAGVSRLLSAAATAPTDAPALAQGSGGGTRARSGSGSASTSGAGGASRLPAAPPGTVEAVALLLATLRVVVTVGALFAMVIAPFAAGAGVLLLGPRWAATEAPAALAAYCVYVLFCGVNGPTEAFAVAVADPARLRGANLQYAAFFVAYAIVAAGLAPALGVRAFIAANCGNMALRVVSSWYYIAGKCREWAVPLPAQQAVISRSTAAAWVAIAAVAIGTQLQWHAELAAEPHHPLLVEGSSMKTRVLAAAPLLLRGVGAGAAAIAALIVFDRAAIGHAWRVARGKT